MYDLPWCLSDAERTEFDRKFESFPFPQGFCSIAKRPFDGASYLKGNDMAYILSSVGVWCLATTELPLDQRRVLMRLCRLRTAICKAELSLVELAELGLEVQEALTEYELYFPFSVMTINCHMLLHLPDQIRRAGPVTTHWMYPIERVMGRLVDEVHSLKCAEESIVRNYLVSELMQHRRVGHHEFQSPLTRLARHGQDSGDLSLHPLFGQAEQVCSVHGKGVEVALSLQEQAEVLALWRKLDSELDSLFTRYEQEVKQGVTDSSIQNWTPSTEPMLTDTQLIMRFAPLHTALQYCRAHRNAVQLRAEHVDRKFTRTNCCFQAVHHVLGDCVGIVDSFLVHRAYFHPDAPQSVFVRVASWCKPIANDADTGLPRCEQTLSNGAGVDRDVEDMDVDELPSAVESPWLTTKLCAAGDIIPTPITLTLQSETAHARVYIVHSFGRA